MRPADRPRRAVLKWSLRQRSRRVRRHRMEGRRRRRLPPVSVLPTLCTLGNLIAGFAAIHYAAKPVDYAGPWNWTGLTFAAVLIFLGMVFDAVDGSLARLTRSTTDLGAHLDSLADMVTFGIAPAFMTVVLVGLYVTDGSTAVIIGPEADSNFGRIIWGVAAVYVSCAALRLARFNVETPSAAASDHRTFSGLPSPGAAGAVASLILLHQHLEANFDEEVPQAFVRAAAMGIPFITLLCAVAMVSSLPYGHVINQYLRGRRSFTYIVWIVIPLVLLIWFFPFVVAVGFCTYVLSAPVQSIWKRLRHGRAKVHAAMNREETGRESGDEPAG